MFNTDTHLNMTVNDWLKTCTDQTIHYKDMFNTDTHLNITVNDWLKTCTD